LEVDLFEQQYEEVYFLIHLEYLHQGPAACLV
jgi:hypothetical protein